MAASARKISAWSLSLLLLAALSWHAGLHAWQVLLATAATAAIVLGLLPQWSPQPRMLVGLAGLVLWQWFGSGAPWLSLSGVAWGVTLLALGSALRDSGTPPALWRKGLLLWGVLAALFIVGLKFWVRQSDPSGAGAEAFVQGVHQFFPNQNLFAIALLVPALLLSLALIVEAPSAGIVAVLALLTAALGLCGSRGALLALSLGGLWLVGRARTQHAGAWKRGALALALVVAGIAAWPGGLSSKMASEGGGDAYRYQRLQFWKASWKAGLEHPWAGTGLGTYAQSILRQDVATELTPSNPIARHRLRLEHAHNEVLEAAVELGWPVTMGLTLLALFWFRARWHKRSSSPDVWAIEAWLVALAAHSMVDMPLHPPFIQMGVVLAWAWLDGGEAVPQARSSRIVAVVFFALTLAVASHHWMLPRASSVSAVDIQSRPYDAFAWMALARENTARGQWQAAEAAVATAIQLEPNFLDAWRWREARAKVMKQDQKLAEARREIARIRSLKVPAEQAQDAFVRALLSESGAPL